MNDLISINDRIDQLKEWSKGMLNYGRIKLDIEIKGEDGFHRIRIIERGDKKYFHHMFNGEIVDIYEV